MAGQHGASGRQVRIRGAMVMSLALAMVLVAGCSTVASVSTTQAATTTEAASRMPTAVMSEAEMRRWQTEALAFAERYYEVYPDVDAQLADFADDATFYDPSTGDFLVEGIDGVTEAFRAFTAQFADLQTEITGVYLSADAAAYGITRAGIWPPGVPEPSDHPPFGELNVFHFEDGVVAGLALWFTEAIMEELDWGCFTPEGCGPDLRDIAQRYLAAWSSGDEERIAALYRDDAVFSDSLLGIQAQGSEAIAALSDERFGTGADITFEVIDLYAQTNGPDPPAEYAPKQGQIIGVGIHYRCTLRQNGETTTLEGVTTFELVNRQGSAFDIDPDGLIAREEVFHDPDSLVTAGLTS